MKFDLTLRRQFTVVVIVALVFVLYMEAIYLPHFNPWLYYNNYDILSYPPELQNTTIGRFINVGGVLLFFLSVIGGQSLIPLLESLRKQNDNLGCISAKNGRYKENEPC